MTDYAIVCLCVLSNKMNNFMNAQQISVQSGLSLPTVQKVMKLIGSKSDFIITLRGSNGGYKLTKSVSDISIINVIEMMDGPVSLTACVDGNHEKCVSRKTCFLEGNWNKINMVIRDTLQNYSIADLMCSEPVFLLNENKIEEKIL
tara:strand:+ start:151 stop:588 length:438 start_codon:yes stop_codon:yes gene_type:complete